MEERRRREGKAQRAATRAVVAGTVTAPVSRSSNAFSRWWRRTYPPGDPLAPRRRRRTLVLLAIFLVVQVLAWWLYPSWAIRLGVLLLSVLLLPVVRVMIWDRR